MPFFVQGILLGWYVSLTALLTRWGAAMIFMGLSTLGSVVKKIMAFLGFAAVTYIGINTVSTLLVDYLDEQALNLPVDVLAMLGIMQLDKAISLIVSAGLVKNIMNGLNAATGSTTRQTMKSPDTVSGPFSNGGRTF